MTTNMDKELRELIEAVERLMDTVDVGLDDSMEHAVWITSFDRWPERHERVAAVRAALDKLKLTEKP